MAEQDPRPPLGGFCADCGGVLAGPEPRVCTACGRTAYRDPKVGVGAVVRDEQGRLLLVQRGIAPAKGLWSLPAGFVDADEDPRAAAAREVREETGLEVEVGDVVDVWAGGGGKASFFLAFTGTVRGGALQSGDDAVDARWFALDDVPDLAFASTHAVVERLRAARLAGQPLGRHAGPAADRARARELAARLPVPDALADHDGEHG